MGKGTATFDFAFAVCQLKKKDVSTGGKGWRRTVKMQGIGVSLLSSHIFLSSSESTEPGVNLKLVTARDVVRLVRYPSAVSRKREFIS